MERLEDGPTIALWVFLKYTNSLSDKFKKVQLRLISAFGIDVSNDNVRIDWEQFLRLKRFLELFVCSEEELQDILNAITAKRLHAVHEGDASLSPGLQEAEEIVRFRIEDVREEQGATR